MQIICFVFTIFLIFMIIREKAITLHITDLMFL